MNIWTPATARPAKTRTGGDSEAQENDRDGEVPPVRALTTPASAKQVLGGDLHLRSAHDSLVPKAIWFSHGVGVHKDRLSSFEMALRDADVEIANLVTVSSIFPPHCKEIGRKEGSGLVRAGQIVHCVMARQDTNEPNRLVCAAIGLARPADPEMYGYLSEHHSYGETGRRAGDYAEDLAATMLATTLGIEFDPEKAYDERKEVYRMSRQIVRTRSIVQSAEGDKRGRWTTVIALGIFAF